MTNDSLKVLAITPARGGSKGVPRKNIKILAGKPLLQHTIEAASRSTLINSYIVNTEDREIRSFAESLGVLVQDRPEEFWHDNTFQEVDRLLQWSVLDYEEKFAKVDIVVLLYPTAPLRASSAIDSAIELISNKGFDSSLTLCEDRSYLWQKLSSSSEVKPTNYDPKKRGPNQLEGWNQWKENKAVYAVRRDLLLESGCRLGGKIGYVSMSKLDSIDIDTPEDFALAEQLMLLRNTSL